MTPKSGLDRFFRRLLLAAFVCPLLATTLLAQATGTVAGRVYDQETGRSLQGAIVTVVGSTARDITDPDGRYSIPVRPGTHTIEVDYVGLDKFQQTVTVAAGVTSSLNAPLRSDVLQLESFEVREAARGQALAINQQRTAAGIINIVSEEVFGQMTDGNVGTALQRLPGISVNEDQDGSAGDINIRGIEGAYNSVQVDGNRMPNSGGGSRAFNPRQMAADGVTNIEVIKAPTPDRDGDAIGGIVNLVSRSAFQRDGRSMRLKVSGVYSDLPKKWGHAASLQYSDIFSVAGGERNLGISATVSSYKTNRYSINADIDWEQITPENSPPAWGMDQYGDRPVWFMEATHWEYDYRVTKTKSFNASIDFRTDEHNSFYVRPMYSHYDRKGITFETDIDIDTRFQDAPGGRKTYAFITPTTGGATPGANGSRGSRGWIGTDRDDYNDLYSLTFGGRHERQDSLLTYDFMVSRTKNVVKSDTELDLLMQPTNPYIVHEYRIVDIAKGNIEIFVTNGVDVTDLSLMTLGNLFMVSSVKDEDLYSARLDWEKTITGDRGVFTFKTGAKYRSSRPRFDRTLDRYLTGNGNVFPYASVVEPTNASLFLKPKYYDAYPDRAIALLASNPELFTYNPGASLEGSHLRDYDATENTSAAYVMGTYRLGIHTIIGGVRYEKNDWKSQRTRVVYPGGVPTPSTENFGSSYDYFLPGLHFRHELRPNLILRESFNQSYGKPKLSELTLGRVVATNGNITDGNPNLKPAFANNFDIQLEYYTKHSGLYSVGFFYKDVKDFSFREDSRFLELDANGEPMIIPGATSGLRYRRFVNGNTAEQYGIELIARQRLVFLPRPFDGFTASTSATFTESKAKYSGRDDRNDLTLPGFSPVLFTGTLEYARGRFSARADYRYRDAFVEGLGTGISSDEYYAAEERLDAEVSFQIRKGLSVFASGTNLLGGYQLSYQGYKQFIEDASYSGRKITVGMEYRF